MAKECLFCKSDSTSSKSVEHIVPESLWNTQHVLPPGVVCDACNNYFAREVEKPFLDSSAMTQLRFQEAIPNKRGRVPVGSALLAPGFPVVAHRHLDGPVKLTLDVPPEAFAHILNAPNGTLVIPASGTPPEKRVISRFLAKMAIEALAHRLLRVDGGVSYVANEVQFDPLRRFARRGEPKAWPHHARRLYPAHRQLTDEDGNAYQTVHEFDFLVTDRNEWYFLFTLFGLELVINVGGPDIDGYVEWLRVNQGASPLYHGKNAKPNAS